MAATSTLTSNAPSTPIVLNQDPISWSQGMSVLVNFSGGGPAVATVDVQLSNNYNPNAPTTAMWNNHDSLSGLTADANGILTVPVGAIRLNPSPSSPVPYSSGTVTLGIGNVTVR